MLLVKSRSQVYLILSFLLLGCSSGQKLSLYNGELGYNRSLASAEKTPLEVSYDHAFEEAHSLEASLTTENVGTAFLELKPSFNLFQNEIKSFKVIVFPKVSTITKKTDDSASFEFGRPITYKWSVTHKDLCRNIIAPHNKNFPKSKTAFQFVSAELKSDPDLLCAAFRVQIIKPDISRLNFKSGELIEVTVYLDSKYRSYALLQTYAQGKRNKKDIMTILDSYKPLSSGLSFFPIDLPLMIAPISTNLSIGKNTLSPGFSITNSTYVKNRFSRETQNTKERQQKLLLSQFFSPCNKSGKLIEYFDSIGDLNRMGWCPNESFPRFSENQKFLALLDVSDQYNK